MYALVHACHTYADDAGHVSEGIATMMAVIMVTVFEAARLTVKKK